MLESWPIFGPDSSMFERCRPGLPRFGQHWTLHSGSQRGPLFSERLVTNAAQGETTLSEVERNCNMQSLGSEESDATASRTTCVRARAASCEEAVRAPISAGSLSNDRDQEPAAACGRHAPPNAQHAQRALGANSLVIARADVCVWAPVPARGAGPHSMGLRRRRLRRHDRRTPTPRRLCTRGCHWSRDQHLLVGGQRLLRTGGGATVTRIARRLRKVCPTCHRHPWAPMMSKTRGRTRRP